MTSATDELRRLLDERGVEWGNVRNDGSESDYLTEWQFDGIEGHAIATEWSIGNLTVCVAHPMTPAQAIDATLGLGTCEVECFDDGMDEGMDGHWFAYAPPTWYLSCSHKAYGQRPSYCPVCGRKVKED